MKALLCLLALGFTQALVVRYEPLEPVCTTLKESEGHFEECVFSGSWHEAVDEGADASDACVWCVSNLDGVKRLIESNTSYEAILGQFLEEACAPLGEDDRDLCVHHTLLYNERVIALIASGVSIPKVCTLLEVCGATPGIATPVVTVSPQPLLGENDCHSSPAVVCSSIPIAKRCKRVELCQKHVWSDEQSPFHVRVADDSTECRECQMIFDYVQQALQSNDTREEIANDVQNVCERFFSNDQCEEYIGNYLPEILAMLGEEMTPVQVCGLLDFCQANQAVVGSKGSFANCPTSMKKLCADAVIAKRCGAVELCLQTSWMSLVGVRSEWDSGETCAGCKAMVEMVKQYLDSEATVQEITDAAEELCHYCPNGTQCVATIKEYLPEILNMLEMELDPSTVCQMVKMCDAQATVDTPPRKHSLVGADECVMPLKYVCVDLDTAMKCGRVDVCLRTEWSGLPSGSDSGEACEGCKAMVEMVKQYLDSDSTVEQITQAAEDLCQYCPNATECVQTIDKYLPEIIKMVDMGLEPDSVCRMVKMCASPATLRTLQSGTKCDDGSQCAADNTCCKMGADNTYGCCPTANAVCCPDMLHCCPHGFTCSTQGAYCERSDSQPPFLFETEYGPGSAKSRHRREVDWNALLNLIPKPDTLKANACRACKMIVHKSKENTVNDWGDVRELRGDVCESMGQTSKECHEFNLDRINSLVEEARTDNFTHECPITQLCDPAGGEESDGDQEPSDWTTLLTGTMCAAYQHMLDRLDDSQSWDELEGSLGDSGMEDDNPVAHTTTLHLIHTLKALHPHLKEHVPPKQALVNEMNEEHVGGPCEVHDN